MNISTWHAVEFANIELRIIYMYNVLHVYIYEDILFMILILHTQ